MTSLSRTTRRVRFCCFLEELDNIKAVADDVQDALSLIVTPSFEFQRGVTLPPALARRARFRENFIGDVPLAWIEDDVTRALRPFWIDPGHISLFQLLIAGERPPAVMPVRLQSLLLAAGILVREVELPIRRREGERRTREAAMHFATADYCTLSDILHPAHLSALAGYYGELIGAANWMLGDGQVAARYGRHNEPLARFFHHQLATYVGQVVGESVKPSYAYVSAYQEGAILERHVDREQCEFTLSILIDRCPRDASGVWPLFLDTPGGRVAVEQQIGDAVLFRGPKLPHYRERLAEGRTSTSLLFHYVPASFLGTLN